MKSKYKKMDKIGILISSILFLFFIFKVIGLNNIYSGSLAISITLILFSFLPFFKEFRQSFPDGTSTLLTIVGVLMSVYLSFVVTKDYTEKSEKIKEEKEISKETKRKIEIVKKLQSDALKVKYDLEAYYDRYYNLFKGKDSEISKNSKKEGLKAPIEKANFINTYLSQESGLILLHNNIIPMFSRANQDLKYSLEIIPKTKFTSFKQFKDVINFTILQCTYMFELLNIQIDFIDGKINDEQVLENRKRLSYTHFRSSTEDPNNTIVIQKILPEDRQFPIEKELSNSTLNGMIQYIEDIRSTKSIKNKEILLEYFENGDSILLPQIQLFLTNKGYKVILTGRVAATSQMSEGMVFSEENGKVLIQIGNLPIAPY